MFEFHLLDTKAFGTFRVDLVFHIDAFEWKVTKEHSEKKNADCPDINFVIVDLFFEDLRSHVRSGSTESVDIFIVFSTESQIAYFDCVAVRFRF